MDLGTIRQKLKSKPPQYKTLFQVGEDVRLVWTNCMTYNQDGSDFYKLANQLHHRWDEKYTKLLSECSPTTSGADGGGSREMSAAEASAKTTLQEKRNFAKSLFSISKEDLGRILVEIEAKCPMALTRNSTEDEVEMNIDKISPMLLQELNKFVESASKKKTSKSGSSSSAQPASKKAKT